MIYFFLTILITGAVAVVTAMTMLAKPRLRHGKHDDHHDDHGHHDHH